MQYLNNSFWRMICGFIVVLILAIGFLFLTQIYSNSGGEKEVSPIDYLAGSKADE